MLRIFCHGSSNVEKNKRQCGDKITGYKGLFLEFIQKPRQTQQEHNSELVIKISPPWIKKESEKATVAQKQTINQAKLHRKEKGQGGSDWVFLENLEVFQTKHWQRARWGRRSSRKKLPSRSLLQVELKVKMLVALSCLTLCDPVNCSQPGSSVRGIL